VSASVAIFGATSAIAERVARIYARRGARLFLAARNQNLLAAIAADLRVRGALNVSIYAGDLSDVGSHDDVLRACETAVAVPEVALIAWGGLGEQERSEAEPIRMADELVMNFVGPACLAASLTTRMLSQNRGALAVITSVAGERGRRSNYTYGAGKAGLSVFLAGLRHRLHGSSVASVDVRPGFVDTPMTEHMDRGGLLWASPERVAADIVRAIDGRRPVVYTPWFWRWIMLVVRNIPEAVFVRTRL
jgi:short-subunit dehydrogenase